MMTRLLIENGAIRRLEQGRRAAKLAPGWIEVELPDGIDLTRLHLAEDGNIVVIPAPPPRRFAVDDLADPTDRMSVRQARARDFATLSDPMIGPLLRGEITQEQFSQIATDIRARHPYPASKPPKGDQHDD